MEKEEKPNYYFDPKCGFYTDEEGNEWSNPDLDDPRGYRNSKEAEDKR